MGPRRRQDVGRQLQDDKPVMKQRAEGAGMSLQARAQQPWASVEAASEYVVDLIDQPLWETLKSRLRLGRAVGLRGREVASFLRVQADIAEVKQRLARTVRSVKRLGLHAPAEVADTAITMVDELARCFDYLALEGVSAQARASLLGHFAKPVTTSRTSRTSSDAEGLLVRDRAAALGGEWCTAVCKERPQLAPCLTGTFFAYASIGAQVEQACATAALFNARRVWWDRAVRRPD